MPHYENKFNAVLPEQRDQNQTKTNKKCLNEIVLVRQMRMLYVSRSLHIIVEIIEVAYLNYLCEVMGCLAIFSRFQVWIQSRLMECHFFS